MDWFFASELEIIFTGPTSIFIGSAPRLAETWSGRPAPQPVQWRNPVAQPPGRGFLRQPSLRRLRPAPSLLERLRFKLRKRPGPMLFHEVPEFVAHQLGVNIPFFDKAADSRQLLWREIIVGCMWRIISGRRAGFSQFLSMTQETRLRRSKPGFSSGSVLMPVPCVFPTTDTQPAIGFGRSSREGSAYGLSTLGTRGAGSRSTETSSPFEDSPAEVACGGGATGLSALSGGTFLIVGFGDGDVAVSARSRACVQRC